MDADRLTDLLSALAEFIPECPHGELEDALVAGLARVNVAARELGETNPVRLASEQPRLMAALTELRVEEEQREEAA